MITGACGSATTDAAAFYFGPPRVENDPLRFLPACIGSTTTLFVEPLGTAFSSAQWMRNGADIVDDARHFGANSYNLTITKIEPADFTATFSVRLQNSCGTFVSQPASIPQVQPIAFAAQRQSQAVCPGSAAMLTAPPAVEQGSVVFWQVEDPSIPDSWSDIFSGGPLPGIGECWQADFPAAYTLRVWRSGAAECPSSLRFRCIHFSNCGFAQSDAATVSDCRGDMNCDGVSSVGDIGAFVLALTHPAAYASAFPNCNIDAADVNGDGVISVGDIGPFVALLTQR